MNSALKNGRARMSLPPSFVDQLLLHLQPLCAGKGYVSMKRAMETVGRAERVAQVILEAKPFFSSIMGRTDRSPACI